MDKKYLSDFGFVISDEENIFDRVNEVSDNDINNVESATITNSIIDEDRESNPCNSKKT